MRGGLGSRATGTLACATYWTATNSTRSGSNSEFELRRLAERVPIEPQVFDLLLYLIDNRGRVVGKTNWSTRFGAGGSFPFRP